MTSNNGNRDDELELIRQLLIATASRAESTDARLDRLIENQDLTQQRLDQLAIRQDRTQQQLDQLSVDVDIAFQTISLMSQNTDREMAEFRTAILGIQEENRRIWQYLLGQHQNGKGDQPQQ